MAIDSSGYDVAQIPFPAITICSNNKIVDRQLESVLLTQPWQGLAKQDPEFPKNFRKALTAIVMARENPSMLNDLGIETINILNKYNNTLPDILKKVSLIENDLKIVAMMFKVFYYYQVMLTCEDMILECYWFREKYDDCTDLFDVRHTDDGYCCSFNTLPMSEQL